MFSLCKVGGDGFDCAEEGGSSRESSSTAAFLGHLFIVCGCVWVCVRYINKCVPSKLKNVQVPEEEHNMDENQRVRGRNYALKSA